MLKDIKYLKKHKNILTYLFYKIIISLKDIKYLNKEIVGGDGY